MTKVEWIVTTCGGKKLPYPAPCEQMYRGSFAQHQMKAARSVLPSKGHIILSNRYGYMRPGTIIEPYDSHWGHEDTMTDEALRDQIREIGFSPGDRVVHLGARVYSTVSVRLMPPGVEVYWLPGVLPSGTGIGYQRRLHSHLINTKNLPTGWERSRLSREGEGLE